MVPLLYIFPIIFLVMAIIAFFIDLDEPKGKMIFIGLAFVLVIMLIGNETTVHMQVSHADKLQSEVEQIEGLENWPDCKNEHNSSIHEYQ